MSNDLSAASSASGAEPARRPPPKGWPRIFSALFYDEPAQAIDWLCRVFGFSVRLRIEGENGRIEHSELELGDGLIMVGNSGGRSDRPDPLPARSPRALGKMNTQMLCVFVDDVDAHHMRARAAGARIIDAPETHDHGAEYWADRTYRAEDLEGHQWFFMQRVREAEPRDG